MDDSRRTKPQLIAELRRARERVAQLEQAHQPSLATEQALRESEQRFRTLFENIPVGIYRTTPDGRILEANPALVKMLGFTSFDELARRNLEEEGFEPAYPRSEFRERIEREGWVTIEQVVWKRRDGSVIFVREHAKVVRDAAGRVKYYEGTVEDLTEQRRGADMLRIQRDLDVSLTAVDSAAQALQRLLAASLRTIAPGSGGAYLVDETSQALELAAYQGLPAGPSAAAQHFPPESPEVQAVAAGKPIYGHRAVGDLFAALHGRGAGRSLAVIPVRCERRVVGVLALAATTRQDVPAAARHALETMAGRVGGAITRTQAVAAVRESEELFRTVVQASKDAMIAVDREGRVTIFNPAAEKMFARTQAGMIGQPLDDLMPADYRDRHRRYVEGYFTKGVPNQAIGTTLELPALRMDGTVFTIELSLSAGQRRSQPFVLAVIRDITERKRAEEALRESEARQRRLFETVSDAIIVFDPKTGEFTDINDAAVHLYGYSREEFLRLKHSDVTAEPEESVASIRQALEGKLTRIPLRYHQKKDGMVFPVEISTSVVQSGSRRVLCGVVRDITERRRAEVALRNSEETIRTLLNATADAVLLIDANGTTLAANEAIAHRLGRSVGELTGRCIYDFLSPNVAEIRKAKAEEVISSRQPLQYLDESDGSYLDCLIHPLFDAEGNVRSLAVFARDVTDRKRAEEALRESQERYRVLFEQAPDSIVLVDAEKGTLVEFNDRACEHLGYTRAEFQDLRVADLEVIQSHEQVLQHTARVVDEGGDTFETRHRTKTGEIRDVLVITQGVSISGRQGALGIWHDITERKRVEAALRESEERYRTLVENIADGVGLVVDGRMAYANAALCRILGRTPEQVLGRSPAEFHVPDERQLVTQRIHEMMAGVQLAPIVHRYIRPDGELVDVEVTSTVISRAGKPALLSVIRDISARKRSEEEKARLQAQLAQAQKMQAVGQVAAAVAHEFGNLLAVARQGVQQLWQVPEMQADTRETLRVVEQAVEEAASSTRSLLMFSRSLPVERSVVDLCQLLKDSAQVLRHLLPKSIKLQAECVPEQPCWVYADPRQLRQVLLNLTLNARDAMPAGGQLHLRVGPADDDPTARITQLVVHDTGSGMSPDIQQRVFEPFFTTKASGGGTGLGLTTVQSIVRDHGGKIEVASAVGEGTTFTVALPRVTPAAAATPPPHGNGEIILLAESNRHARRLIVSTLRSWNYEVLTPAKGRTWLEEFQRDPAAVAAIIVRVEPPDADECERIRALRSAGHRTPVVLIVGADSDTEEQTVPTTVLLPEPFQMAELGNCLRNLLAR